MDCVPVSSPMSGISHYATERLVTTSPENASIAQPGTPITRGQLLDTDFGPLPSSAAQITIRRRTANQDSAPGSSREDNWRNSSLRPPRLKLPLWRPQLWRLRRPPGAISICWIWSLGTGPAKPSPPLDPIRALVRRAHAHRRSSRHSYTCGSNSKPRPNAARTNAAQTIDVGRKNTAKIVWRQQPQRLHGRPAWK